MTKSARLPIGQLAEGVQGERFVWGTVIGKTTISPRGWGLVPLEKTYSLLVQVKPEEEVIVPVSQSKYERTQLHDQVPIR